MFGKCFHFIVHLINQELKKKIYQSKKWISNESNSQHLLTSFSEHSISEKEIEEDKITYHQINKNSFFESQKKKNEIIL